MNRLWLAILLATAPVAVRADALGHMTMFLDREERVWHTITFLQNDRTVSTAVLQQKANRTEILVQGHPVPEFTSKDVLSIDIRYDGRDAPDDTPAAIEILYTPNGLAGPLWTSRGVPDAPRIQVLEFNAWGNAGYLTALITGQICQRPRLFSQTDTTNCKQINGVIETRLSVE